MRIVRWSDEGENKKGAGGLRIFFDYFFSISCSYKLFSGSLHIWECVDRLSSRNSIQNMPIRSAFVEARVPSLRIGAASALVSGLAVG